MTLNSLSSLPDRAMRSAASMTNEVEAHTSTLPLTAEEVAATDTISSLCLSPDGRQVVYTVRPHYCTGEHATSAIWVADTSLENSARRITSGEVNDHSPSFHPTSGDIYFLSDRGQVGKGNSIYRLQADASVDTAPILAVDLTENQTVASFEVSPDGRLLAFTAKTAQSEAEQKNKGPGRLWRDKDDLASLYIAELRHSRVQGAASGRLTEVIVSEDTHVESFAWLPDSRSIMFRQTSHADLESLQGEPVREAVVDVASGVVRDALIHRRNPGSKSVPRECGDAVFLQNTTPDILLSSQSLWVRDASTGVSTHLRYGVTDDVLEIADLGQSRYAVAVARGLDTTLYVFDAEHNSRTVYETHDDHFSDWDMKAVGADKYVFVVLRSSAVRGESLEIWAGAAEPGALGRVTHQLTAHNTWLSQGRMPVSRLLNWTSPDGQDVQGVMSYPQGASLKNMPTVLVIHGGPTSRDTLDLSFQEWSWRLFLASQGYLILSPNYRGSLGRGDKFVQAANGGMGTTDWMDVQSMLDYSVAVGLTDPDKVGIAGYSQGGFLTAWGITRPNNTFKAAVDGSGVSDWGMLSTSSALPDVEIALAGGAPWIPGEPAYLRGSPIRYCQNVRTPLLLLHGEQDRIVPFSQAIAFLRGVERVGHPQSKPVLISYPGEDHIFQRREHAEDVLRRLESHIKSYL